MIQYLIDVKLKDRNFKAYLYKENYLNDEMEQEKIRFCKEIREVYDKAKSNIDILEVGIKVVE
jgi:hypothetical protein